MQVKKIKSIFELFIKQNIEFKFVLFLIVQTLRVHETGAFMTNSSIFIFSMLRALHGLQEKGCQKSIKQWIFDDPFCIKRPG
jgi:hypothetical protein